MTKPFAEKGEETEVKQNPFVENLLVEVLKPRIRLLNFFFEKLKKAR